MHFSVLRSLTVVTLVLAVSSALSAAELHLAQGALAGEVTSTSVILQTRLTATPRPVEGDVPGAPGVARFEWATSDTFANARQTAWLRATADADFIVLQPDGNAAIGGFKNRTDPVRLMPDNDRHPPIGDTAGHLRHMQDHGLACDRMQDFGKR